MAALPFERVNKIWYWIQSQDCRRLNEQLRVQEKAQCRRLCLEIGLHNICSALNAANGDRKLAAEALGTKPYVITLGYLDYKNSAIFLFKI